MKIFLVSRFLALVNQDLELVEIQFQPTLYLIPLVPFLRVQLINRLHRRHPKIKSIRRLSFFRFSDFRLFGRGFSELTLPAHGSILA